MLNIIGVWPIPRRDLISRPQAETIPLNHAARAFYRLVLYINPPLKR
jgi:hypothetical protein